MTVGHSTRPIEEFVALLRSWGVQTLADVRTVPRSRANPQYARDALAGSLRAAGIAYVHVPGLGGLRHARKDSVNTAWRNESFRGFADYMQTPEFASALEELIDVDAHSRTVIMCAEAVPWRCHRSLIADALAARGIQVQHIFSRTSIREHSITPFARVERGKVTYPA
jgi:uncharacterized protein (DUF488 family)